MSTEPTRIGRYTVYEAFASGGMASVHFGRFAGPGGFARTVAVKRMHPHLAGDAQFVAMFVDEARLAARIHHPCVVATLDVLASSDELLIAMEYVHGEALGGMLDRLQEGRARMPPAIACAIACDVLAGLHAAHEATDERAQPLGIVHRDVSPDNVLVGADGTSRLLDFGVTKAVSRLQVTREGQVKGKIAYMAPEQVRGEAVARTTDVYAVSVVLWEMLVGRPLFVGTRDADLVDKILFSPIDVPAAVAPHVPEPLNAIVLRGLARDQAARFATARDMAAALCEAMRPASATEVGDWVRSVAGDTLAARASRVAQIEGREGATPVVPPPPAKRRGSVRRRMMAMAAGAVCTIALALGAAWRWTRHVTPPPAVSSALVAVHLGDAPTAAATPIASDLSGITFRPTRVAPAVSAPNEVASSRRPISVPSASRRASSPPAPPGVQARDDCTPPYSTDSQGTRRYKLECL